MRWLILIALVLAGCVAHDDTPVEVNTARHAEVYVSPQGDNAADGLTPATAFRTLAHAMQHGHTVRVMPGVYRESITWAGSVTLLGEPGAVLDGERDQPYALWCEPCTDVTVEGLTVRNYTDVGLGFSQSEGIRLAELEVYDNGFAPALRGWGMEGYGIHVEYAREVTITANDVYRNGPNPITRRHPMGTGINVFDCTTCAITDNRNNDNIGGILVEDSHDVRVAGNTITGNYLDVTQQQWWDGGIWIDGGTDITVEDNVIRDNEGPGIQISDEDRQHPSGYVVRGNRIEGNVFGLYIWNFTEEGLPDESVLLLEDNVIEGNTRRDMWVQGIICPTPCD